MSVFVIAEAGVNHDGSLDKAMCLVDEAHAHGADAVKFQTFKADRLVATSAPKADYQERAVPGESQAAMLRRLELGDEAWPALFRRCREIGIEFMSTPFDEESLAMLVRLGVRRLKIGSGDVTHAPLLRAARSTKLPVILSTGMSTLDDVRAAVDELHGSDVTLLHCTTEYPAPIDETNLRAMATMRDAFGLPVGYSDHTEGIAVPVAAVALGAVVVEKHFTLDRSASGPDHAASLEPRELGAMIASIRQIERALGDGAKRPGMAEQRNVKIARRSLVAAMPIAKGTKITSAMLTAKRPAGGVSPMRIDEVVGTLATRDYAIDDAI